ncbi:MAG: bifunctional nuclease family protein [Treponema sp.]|jgi:bifunctional DNase/RNase|nr:bifunctional nuclease family protein [Treponema sp.]
MEKMLHAEIWAIAQTREGSAVLLRPRHKNIAVPIFVGQLEVQSILIAREGMILPRPLTHDLLLKLIDSQNLVLERVEIHDLKDNTFHARLVLSGGTHTSDKPLVLDSRPSDAFGLATRCKCPILVSARIVNETGIPLDLFVDSLDGNKAFSKGGISPLEEERLRLLEQLDEAVEHEDYEQAAEIRDILKRMG